MEETKNMLINVNIRVNRKLLKILNTNKGKICTIFGLKTLDIQQQQQQQHQNYNKNNDFLQSPTDFISLYITIDGNNCTDGGEIAGKIQVSQVLFLFYFMRYEEVF